MDGLGVKLRRLMGDNGAKHFLACKDKKITAVSLENETLRIEVEGGLWVSFTDDGQSCCESRYMVCDDDLPSFVGSTLLDASPGFQAMNQRHRLIWWDRLGFALVVLGILFILLFAGCDTRPQEPGRFKAERVTSLGADSALYRVVDTMTGAEFLTNYRGGIVRIQ